MHGFFQRGLLPSLDQLKQDAAQLFFLTPEQHHQIEIWYREVIQLSFLKESLQNKNVTEFLFHHHQRLQIETAGQLTEVPWKLSSAEDFQLLAEGLALRGQQSWNFQHPFQSFRLNLLGENFRATLVHSSLSPYTHPKVFLRRLSLKPYALSSFFPHTEAQEQVETLAQQKKNIIFCGATGSGKTSLLSSLVQTLPQTEHLIILEDTHEINAPQATFLLANSQQEKKDLADYCAYSLRMRPDRLILGEIRSQEIIPFTLAMNNGHQGLMSTIHSNSAQEALSRMALLFQMYSSNQTLSFELALKLICRNIDYVFFLKQKNVIEGIKVLGSERSSSFVEKVLP